MAGISDQGFTTKRMTEILSDLRAEATALLQDQVSPGDVVDVSDSSALGRLIAIVSPSITDLWEAAQQNYAAFDPNTATGVALDNLVALGGIIRQAQTFAVAQVILTGDTGTTVVLGATVGSSVSSSQWTLIAPVTLNSVGVSGGSFTPLVVSNNTAYTISYQTNTTTNTITYTSGTNATATNIVAGLSSVISLSHPSFTSNINGNILTISRVDPFSTVNITTSSNLGQTKSQKVGEVRSVNAGPVSSEVNTITNILTPQLGFDSVTNPLPASGGVDMETDEELRTRFRETKFERAASTVDSIYSALIDLSTVEQVVVYENDTNATDDKGIPAHSFMPIVLGGVSEEIAQAIWENKPVGIRSFGDTSVLIYDTQGFAHNVAFKRPEPVPIYITLNLTKEDTYPGSGDDDIRNAIIQFFEDNQGIGDDVVYSRLYTPINTVPEHFVNSLRIGTSPNPTGMTNILIDFDQIATISSANILIN